VVVAAGGILTFSQNAAAAQQPDGAPMTSPYSIPAGEAGFYYLKDATIVTDRKRDDAELKVFVRHGAQPDDRQPDVAVQTLLDPGEQFQFDTFLGYLDAGDSVHITLGDKPAVAGKGTEIGYK